MADTKITALTALTAADPANDVIPIVDVSDTSMAASGTTKKISVNNILGASGTATLASATITGDLTVDTSTLKVDSTNNRVGIGTASPAYNLDVIGSASIGGTGSAFTRFTSNGGLTTLGVGAYVSVQGSGNPATGSGIEINGGATPFILAYNRDGSAYLPLTIDGSSVLFKTSGSEKARIDSTGNVGIGVTPSAWNSNYKGLVVGGSGGNGVTIAGNDASIGTGYYLSGVGTYARDNASATASSINMYNRAFVFRTAASGAANSAIAWTDSMTLDASGTLLVGKTASSATTVGIQLESVGSVVSTLAASTSATNTLIVYSTGAAAYRFYVGMGGTVNATNATISAISDARFKENVQDIDVGLNAILSLKPRKFDWKAGKGKDIKGDRGFIAQEFETVFPNLIDEWADPAPEGEAPYKSVRQDLIPVLVKAIQELAAEVNALKNA